LGLGIANRRLVERARRATYGGAFDHLKRQGFDPSTVIDVGVATGTPALYEAFPNARLLLIDPLEEVRPHLEAIARHAVRAEYVVAAAAERSGRVVLHLREDLATTSRYRMRGSGGRVVRREVPALTLDELRRERRLEAPVLLKVDVEGAELDVLRGGTETLTDTEYVILETSLFEFFEGCPQLSDVVGHMLDHGFVVHDVLALEYRPGDGALSMIDLGFVKAAGRFRRSHAFVQESVR